MAKNRKKSIKDRDEHLSDKQTIAKLKRKIRSLEAGPTPREKHSMDKHRIMLEAKNSGYNLQSYQRASASVDGDQLQRAKDAVKKYKNETEKLKVENLKLRQEIRNLKSI